MTDSYVPERGASFTKEGKGNPEPVAMSGEPVAGCSVWFPEEDIELIRSVFHSDDYYEEPRFIHIADLMELHNSLAPADPVEVAPEPVDAPGGEETMIDMQALLDGMGAKWAAERAASDQWTLGQMIEALEALPLEMTVEGVGELESYRGYYSDLSFESSGAVRVTVSEVLADCRAAMGSCFTGYKGGDFYMTANTVLWDSPYGAASGLKVMGLDVTDGVVRLRTESDYDDE